MTCRVAIGPHFLCRETYREESDHDQSNKPAAQHHQLEASVAIDDEEPVIESMEYVETNIPKKQETQLAANLDEMAMQAPHKSPQILSHLQPAHLKMESIDRAWNLFNEMLEGSFWTKILNICLGCGQGISGMPLILVFRDCFHHASPTTVGNLLMSSTMVLVLVLDFYFAPRYGHIIVLVSKRTVKALMEKKLNPEIDFYVLLHPHAPNSSSRTDNNHLKGTFKEDIILMIVGGNYGKFGGLQGLIEHQQNLHSVLVAELPEHFHVGPKFTEALEGISIEFLDGNGDAVGESDLVDESEAAVTNYEIR
ncbi:hypothetical protein SLEP1_g6677 [Rubroshorea leprosula]|uniref:Uncharacterized protein n=1 Tax=Rubroshorea leprosula TaxID=152421 RepID=A0AAV5I6T2_9ROSI|nr:hypothetical protein SLEP1_g6677 [Rubroshorea leprosula]